MTRHISITQDIAACLTLRRVVFIDEQGVPSDLEVDGLDDQAIHILATDNGVPVGCARLLVHGDVCKIGRVCVLPAQRGTGLGMNIMQAAVAQCRLMPGIKQVKLGAQVHAIGFYERLGFAAYGAVFDDAGLPHRDMVLTLT